MPLSQHCLTPVSVLCAIVGKGFLENSISGPGMSVFLPYSVYQTDTKFKKEIQCNVKGQQVNDCLLSKLVACFESKLWLPNPPESRTQSYNQVELC